jgi:triosephosphate isomerase
MRRMTRNGVRILYLPIFTQMELVDTKIGTYTGRNFAQRIHKLGIAVSLIGRSDTFVHAMRVGIKQMLRSAV